MRYDLDIKMQVIAYYRQGHSSHATAKKFNVNREFVFKWVKQYQNGGIDAIKPKTSKAKYSSEFKYKVITTMLKEGLSQSGVALTFNISSPALISLNRPNIMVSEISLTSSYAMDLFYSDESKKTYILLFV